jgi:hypothetical protein
MKARCQVPRHNFRFICARRPGFFACSNPSIYPSFPGRLNHVSELLQRNHGFCPRPADMKQLSIAERLRSSPQPMVDSSIRAYLFRGSEARRCGRSPNPAPGRTFGCV